jgi:hypothetical protein
MHKGRLWVDCVENPPLEALVAATAPRTLVSGTRGINAPDKGDFPSALALLRGYNGVCPGWRKDA